MVANNVVRDVFALATRTAETQRMCLCCCKGFKNDEERKDEESPILTDESTKDAKNVAKDLIAVLRDEKVKVPVEKGIIPPTYFIDIGISLVNKLSKKSFTEKKGILISALTSISLSWKNPLTTVDASTWEGSLFELKWAVANNIAGDIYGFICEVEEHRFDLGFTLKEIKADETHSCTVPFFPCC